MAVPRYYRVLTGARGSLARTKYLEWLEGAQERALDPGEGTSRPESVPLYVVPFSFSLATDTFLRESALLPSWTHCKTIAPTLQYVKETLGAGETAVTIKSYRPARIIRTQKGVREAQKRSAITGLPYRPYANISRSIPFGRKLNVDTVASVGAELLAAYIVPGFSARVTPERT
jgi:hypothetical protein